MRNHPRRPRRRLVILTHGQRIALAEVRAEDSLLERVRPLPLVDDVTEQVDVELGSAREQPQPTLDGRLHDRRRVSAPRARA